MKINKPFSLNYVRSEKHLMLPRISSILLAQNLYDTLFQYIISPAEEANLKNFVSRLEKHIKSKTATPFSIPIDDLTFLQEGLQELRLLNWMEIPISLFTLHLSSGEQVNSDDIEQIVSELNTLMLCDFKNETGLLYVYPSNLVR